MIEGIGTRAPRARFDYLRVLPLHQLVWEDGPNTRVGAILIGHEANHGAVGHILAKLIFHRGFKGGGRSPICHNLIGTGRGRHAVRHTRRKFNRLRTGYHVQDGGIAGKSGHCSVFRSARQNCRGQGSRAFSTCIGRSPAAKGVNPNPGAVGTFGWGRELRHSYGMWPESQTGSYHPLRGHHSTAAHGHRNRCAAIHPDFCNAAAAQIANIQHGNRSCREGPAQSGGRRYSARRLNVLPPASHSVRHGSPITRRPIH